MMDINTTDTHPLVMDEEPFDFMEGLEMDFDVSLHTEESHNGINFGGAGWDSVAAATGGTTKNHPLEGVIANPPPLQFTHLRQSGSTSDFSDITTASNSNNPTALDHFGDQLKKLADQIRENELKVRQSQQKLMLAKNAQAAACDESQNDNSGKDGEDAGSSDMQIDTTTNNSNNNQSAAVLDKAKDFFEGKRLTITEELEQSRRQIWSFLQEQEKMKQQQVEAVVQQTQPFEPVTTTKSVSATVSRSVSPDTIMQTS